MNVILLETAFPYEVYPFDRRLETHYLFAESGVFGQPSIHVFFRPEEVHVLSSIGQVIKPLGGRDAEVYQEIGLT